MTNKPRRKRQRTNKLERGGGEGEWAQTVFRMKMTNVVCTIASVDCYSG